MAHRNFPFNDFPFNDPPYKDFPNLDFPVGSTNSNRGSNQQIKKHHASSTSTPGAGLYHLVLPLFLIAYSPFFYLGYKVGAMIDGSNHWDVKSLVIGLAVGYIAYELLGFLKGLMMRFKHGGNLLWLPLALVVLVIGCYGPCFVVYSLFSNTHTFPQHDDVAFWIFSTPFAAILFFFYYRLHRDIPPPLAKKGYRMAWK